MPYFLEHIRFAVQFDVARDEKIKWIREQANVEANIPGE